MPAVLRPNHRFFVPLHWRFSQSEETSAGLPSGRDIQQNGRPSGRLGKEDEERFLISEVLVRNKDGEEFESKDLEAEALAALKASPANSALTVREVQADVHRLIDSGTFAPACRPAVDTCDGIRLVF